MSDNNSTPRHIGYIVDGNRRWAKEHGLPSYEGHLAGYNAIQDVVRATMDAGVEYVSAYIFSTENWKRSEEEVGKLMGLVLKMLTADLKFFIEEGVRLLIMGTREGLNSTLLEAIENAESETARGRAGTVALCFNYGGQLEIVDACKRIIQSGVSADDVTPELIADNLYHPDVPPCDLIVRTSSEERLSNFMLWRAAYSELMFIDKKWPDMTKEDVGVILEEYANRNRRFGG